MYVVYLQWTVFQIFDLQFSDDHVTLLYYILIELNIDGRKAVPRMSKSSRKHIWYKIFVISLFDVFGPDLSYESCAEYIEIIPTWMIQN